MYDETLLYVHLGRFARHLVRQKQLGNDAEFAEVFGVIERLHSDGDPYVREAATIGLLEGIQNVARHGTLDPETFLPYLGTESARWWQKLNNFWDGDLLAMCE